MLDMLLKIAMRLDVMLDTRREPGTGSKPCDFADSATFPRIKVDLFAIVG